VKLQRAIELTASGLSGIAILMGTTTIAGETAGLVSCIPWWALMLRLRLWGLLPSNVLGTVLFAYNLWRSLHAH
jgi:hypothetical protein